MSTTQRAAVIHYLDTCFTHPVRDPLWGHIYLDPAMLPLLYSEPFQQLNRIRQLGPTFLVYPGATHTRLNHSLGVLHMARRLIRTLITHEAAPDLSLEGVKGFLCAALLHDVGHFPYTHSLKELPLKEHEVLTGDIIRRMPLAGILKDTLGIDPVIPARIVDLHLPADTCLEPDDGRNPASSDQEISFFRRLLSSPLDPDKLDYLNRDAYFCGVPYGTQDSDYVLSQVLPHPDAGIGLDEGGISALEHLLFSKYQMYRAVYWHRTVRIATGMIKKGLYLGIRSGALQTDQLYNLDDESFFKLADSCDAPEFGLISAVQSRRLHQTIYEAPFDNTRPQLQELCDLSRRTAMERRLADTLSRCLGKPVSEMHLLIDIPEAISFEVDIPVRTADGWIPYSRARSVFTPQVVRDFTETLRLVRIAVDPRVLPLPETAITALATELQHGVA
ncbi:HD domain-containing protein [Spirochaeta africana]|uniref:HD superfamily phosphohydrolase n=1 Tax=Spirochaeta africana (strain ATCC 700263 / DSM 8902 / Z-7692) TaxID=889378 RepID=H9UKM3_SPIAZ|nr:HD domain-containing protein [Spirochaeta africana]AFG38066.1 HD superfamily phosphohydrolase [Spirochaeta africana DSM 8902]